MGKFCFKGLIRQDKIIEMMNMPVFVVVFLVEAITFMLRTTSYSTLKESILSVPFLRCIKMTEKQTYSGQLQVA